MILVENRKIGDIPVLHLIDENLYQKEKLPFVMFLHGFQSAKEHNLHYAYYLANKGYRIALPDALFHGERENGKIGNLEHHFWEIILTSLEEIDIIKDYFEQNFKIDHEKIGLAGTSMGGIVTLGALTKHSWIKAAISLMGMPYYERFARMQMDGLRKNGISLPLKEEEVESLFGKLREFDLGRQPEKLNGRPLLFWHGKKDPIVPYRFTYEFYEKIKPLYTDYPEKLKFITDENAGHKVTREGVLKFVDWFETFLPMAN